MNFNKHFPTKNTAYKFIYKKFSQSESHPEITESEITDEHFNVIQK